MWTAEMQIWNENMIMAVVIAIYWVDALCLVNTTKKSHLVTSGQTVRIQCRTNTRAIHRRTLVLFEPDEVGQWSSGLTVLQSLQSTRQGGVRKTAVSSLGNSCGTKVQRTRDGGQGGWVTKRTKYARPTKKQQHRRPLAISGLIFVIFELWSVVGDVV